MKKQMQAERTRHAAIPTAEGDKHSSVLKAQGEKESAIPRDQGEAEAYRDVQTTQIEMAGRLVERLESLDLSAEALRYLYLKTLPKVAKGPASKLFVIPSELQDLAGAVGALAGGIAMAGEDSKGPEDRRLPTINGEQGA